jgi:hypothetical protein
MEDVGKNVGASVVDTACAQDGNDEQALAAFSASLASGDVGPLLVALGAHLTSPDAPVRRRATGVLAAAL